MRLRHYYSSETGYIVKIASMLMLLICFVYRIENENIEMNCIRMMVKWRYFPLSRCNGKIIVSFTFCLHFIDKDNDNDFRIIILLWHEAKIVNIIMRNYKAICDYFLEVICAYFLLVVESVNLRTNTAGLVSIFLSFWHHGQKRSIFCWKSELSLREKLF